MAKIQILNSCLDCGYHKWIQGKPRCKHPETKLEHMDEDGIYYPRCPTDGTKAFLDDCPLIDTMIIGVSKQWFVEEIELRMGEK